MLAGFRERTGQAPRQCRKLAETPIRRRVAVAVRPGQQQALVVLLGLNRQALRRDNDRTRVDPHPVEVFQHVSQGRETLVGRT